MQCIAQLLLQGFDQFTRRTLFDTVWHMRVHWCMSPVYAIGVQSKAASCTNCIQRENLLACAFLGYGLVTLVWDTTCIPSRMQLASHTQIIQASQNLYTLSLASYNFIV